MINRRIFPVILCGGIGTRLWPLSRKSFPKQYLSINSSKSSLLQQTIERIKGIKDIKGPIIICNEEHRFLVAEQIREIGIKPEAILLEPSGRNTSPAITLAALMAKKKVDDPILLVLSSDHLIKNKKKFIEVIEKGIKSAIEDRLVTFGIVPTFPETGFGYIKSKRIYDNNTCEGNEIVEFIEKPDLKKAKEFLKEKKYTWNSGMFTFKANTFLKELGKNYPEIIEYCTESIIRGNNDLDFVRLDKSTFEKCPNISIDIAVMEKTKIGIVFPLDVGWSDIGNWKSVWENSEKDIYKNVSKGKVILKNSKNSLLRSENRLIVGIGLENLIVVETNDAVLVVNKNHTQEVKEIVEEMQLQGLKEGLIHQKIYRPWGNYNSIIEDKKWQVKLINVKPKEALSLQLHNYRSEHWVIVSGKAKVEIEDKVLFLSENQSTYIPVGAKHRLTNVGELPLAIIEVQSGSYIGEDDIVRFEDKYGRLN